MPHSFKTIFLDIDDTLYDYQLANNAGMLAAEKFFIQNFKISKDSYNSSFRKARSHVKEILGPVGSSHSRLLYFQSMLEILNLKFSADTLLNLEKIYWNEYLENMSIFDGVYEFLRHLNDKNINISAITDLTLQIQLEKLAVLKVDHFFNYITSSEEAGIDKPHKKIFKIALNKEGLDANDCAMIGDNYEKDILGAKNIGMVSFWKTSHEDQLEADFIFNNFHDLKQCF